MFVTQDSENGNPEEQLEKFQNELMGNLDRIRSLYFSMHWNSISVKINGHKIFNFNGLYEYVKQRLQILMILKNVIPKMLNLTIFIYSSCLEIYSHNPDNNNIYLDSLPYRNFLSALDVPESLKVLHLTTLYSEIKFIDQLTHIKTETLNLNSNIKDAINLKKFEFMFIADVHVKLFYEQLQKIRSLPTIIVRGNYLSCGFVKTYFDKNTCYVANFSACKIVIKFFTEEHLLIMSCVQRTILYRTKNRQQIREELEYKPSSSKFPGGIHFNEIMHDFESNKLLIYFNRHWSTRMNFCKVTN